MRGGGRPRLEHPKIGDAYASATPHDILVHSQWTIAFPNISASDADSAFKQVHRLHLPPVVSTLTLASGSSVVVNLPYSQEAGESGRWSQSRPATFTPFSPEVLAPDLESIWRQYVSVAISDKVALKACQFLYQADEGSYTSASEQRLLTGALLDYFKCIEVISNDVTARSQKKDDDIINKKHSITKHLEDELRIKTNTQKRLDAISAAQRALNKLDLRASKDRISQAAILLGVEDGDRENALTLAELRNTRLGHTHASEDGLDPYVAPSRSAARAFVAAFLTSRA